MYKTKQVTRKEVINFIGRIKLKGELVESGDSVDDCWDIKILDFYIYYGMIDEFDNIVKRWTT